MDQETIANLAGIGHGLIVFALPLLLMFGVCQRRSVKRWKMPVALAVIIAWFVRILYRTTFENPLYINLAENEGDNMYDGVGGNVATLFFGWIEPLIACLLFVGITRIAHRNRKSEQSHRTASTRSGGLSR